RGSSSTATTGLSPIDGVSINCLTSKVPPLPAPTTNVFKSFCSLLRLLPVMYLLETRQDNLDPPINIRCIIQVIIINLVKLVCKISKFKIYVVRIEAVTAWDIEINSLTLAYSQAR